MPWLETKQEPVRWQLIIMVVSLDWEASTELVLVLVSASELTVELELA